MRDKTSHSYRSLISWTGLPITHGNGSSGSDSRAPSPTSRAALLLQDAGGLCSIPTVVFQDRVLTVRDTSFGMLNGPLDVALKSVLQSSPMSAVHGSIVSLATLNVQALGINVTTKSLKTEVHTGGKR